MVREISSVDLESQMFGASEVYLAGLDNHPAMKQAKARQTGQDFRSLWAEGGNVRKKVDLEAQAPAGAQPTQAPPHGQYYHPEKIKSSAFYKHDEGIYSNNGKNYIALESGKAGLTLNGKYAIEGEELAKVMNQTDPTKVTTDNPKGFTHPRARSRLIQQNGVVELPNGKLAVEMTQSPIAGRFQDVVGGNLGAFSGGQNGALSVDIGQSMLNGVSRNSWLLYGASAGSGALAGSFAGPGGAMVGALLGLGGGVMAAGALRSAAGTANGLALSSNGMTDPSVGNIGGWNIAAGALGGAFPGMEHNARALMQSRAREFKDDAMISMLDNANIPIEDLIFLFMAMLGDNYEEKLREKMRESMIAEKLEERRNRRERAADMQAGMAQGIGGFFGPLGSMAGGVLGQGLKMKAMKENEIESALNGNIKSSTTLANEVQMLMHKWKQLNEMMSTLIKALHEMAMTPIRNIR